MNTFDNLAKKVLHESLRVQKGETVTVETWKTGLEFAKRIILEARKIGASTLLLFEDESTFIESAKTVPKENLGLMGRHEFALLSHTNVYIFIPGPPIAAYTKAVTQDERSAATAYNHAWYDAAEKAGLRGARLSFGYIGSDIAKLYGKSQKAIVSHQLKASFVDLNEMRVKGNQIAAKLEDGFDASIVSREGNINFILEGDAIVEDGIVDDKDVAQGNNMIYIPPGRVRKHINPKSLNGSIEVSLAEIYSGRVEGIKLEFKEGFLSSWSAKRNAKLLDSLVEKITPERMQVSFIELGINPLMKYGNAQDRFVSGAITIGLPRLAGVLYAASFYTKEVSLVEKGMLSL